MMRLLVLLVGLVMHTTAMAKPSPEAWFEPTPEQLGQAFYRSRQLGRAGTVVAGLAVPVTLIGFGFVNSDSAFAVRSGQVAMVAGIAGGLVGVPIMAHAAHRGAKTLRIVDPEFQTPRLNAVWGFHGAAIAFGVAAAATSGRDAPDVAWVWRTPGLTVLSGLCAVTGFTLAQLQLRANVARVGSLAATGQIERFRPRVSLLPMVGPNLVGVALTGAL